jgi:hypothetical protein
MHEMRMQASDETQLVTFQIKDLQLANKWQVKILALLNQFIEQQMQGINTI